MHSFPVTKVLVHGHAVHRVAAFSNGAAGGNPAGVVIADRLPAPRTMLEVAREVADSETVFASRAPYGWHVRYFSPSAEVPFCGHATLALGAILAMQQRPGRFDLTLADARRVSVTAEPLRGLYRVRVDSPRTRSWAEDDAAVNAAMSLFGFAPSDLDPRLPPARVHAGSDHLVIALSSRQVLARMRYEFAAGQALMRQHGWVTIMLLAARSRDQFDTRHAFAYGGVLEDPATGAGAAALAGYLRDIGWMSFGSIRVNQGDDMGVPCRIDVAFTAELGASVSISGTVRAL